MSDNIIFEYSRAARVTARHVCAAACLVVIGATPSIAQQLAPMDSVLQQATAQYIRATSHADSLRSGDSTLAVARALLQRDSVNTWALAVSAKIFNNRGDSAQAAPPLLALYRHHHNALWLVGWALGRAPQALAFAKAHGFLQPLPRDPEVLRVIFYWAAEAQDWPDVVVYGPALLAVDSTAVTLGYLGTMRTAYRATGHPDQADALITQFLSRLLAGKSWQDVTGMLHQGQPTPAAAVDVAQDFLARRPHDLVLLHALFALATDAKDWARVAAVGPALLAADSTVATSTYLGAMRTAYRATGHPDQADALITQLMPRLLAGKSWQDVIDMLHQGQPTLADAVDMAQEFLARRPHDLVLLHALFALATEAKDWARVAAVGPALLAADSAIADSTYITTVTTAAYMLHHPAQAAALLAQAAGHAGGTRAPWRWYADQLQAQLDASAARMARALLREQPEDTLLLRAAYAIFTAEKDWSGAVVASVALAQTDPVLLQAAVQYLQATSRTDSLRYGDSTLAVARALLQRDSANYGALLLDAKLSDDRGDSARVAHTLLALYRYHPGRLQDFALFFGGEQRVLAGLAKAHGLLPFLHDPAALHVIFDWAVETRAWPTVLAVGHLLAEADSTTAYTTVFRQLLSLGRPGLVSAVAEALVRKHPRNPGALYEAFLAFRDVQAWPRVLAVGQTLAGVTPAVRTERRYALAMAVAYAALHRPRQAAAALAPLATAAPTDVATWLWYARELRDAGQPRAAAEAVEHAFRVDCTDPHVTDAAVWLWYARELTRGGRGAAGREALRRAAALAPTDPAVRAAQRDLAGPQRAKPGKS